MQLDLAAKIPNIYHSISNFCTSRLFILCSDMLGCSEDWNGAGASAEGNGWNAAGGASTDR